MCEGPCCSQLSSPGPLPALDKVRAFLSFPSPVSPPAFRELSPLPPRLVPSASLPSHSPERAPQGLAPAHGVGSRAPGQLHAQALPQVQAQVQVEGPWKGVS